MADNPQRDWTMLTLTTLTTVLGFQMVRLFPTYIVFLVSTLSFVTTAEQLGLIGLGTVVIGSLSAGIFWQVFKVRGALLVTAGGLALMRLLVQISPLPMVDLPFVLIGMALFMAYLPVALGVARGHGRAGGSELALGILLGLALDTGLQGVWRTYDPAWRTDVASNIIEYALIAFQLFVLLRVSRVVSRKVGTEAGWSASLAFVGIGAFIMLHSLQFQNVARLTVFTETLLSRWSQAVAFTSIVVANVLTVIVAQRVGARGRPVWTRTLWGMFVLVLLLVLSVSLTPPERPQGTTALAGIANVLGLIVGSAVSAFMLTVMLRHLAEGGKAKRLGLWRLAVGSTLASLLYMVSLFTYQASYQIRMPFSNAVVAPITAVLLALPTLLLARRLVSQERRTIDWRPACGAATLIVLPLLLAVLTPKPSFEQGNGGPLRIVDYNLHMGFNTQGRLDMEALAAVMLDNEADIVVLQEVARGWQVAGSMDMLSWLSNRLDMPYVWGPAADSQWGNAILSRYPIEAFELGALPRGPVAFRRAYMAVEIDYGATENVRIIATHLHHVEQDVAVRLPQIETILDVWGGSPRTLIMGDMNSRPGSPEIGLFKQTNLVDAYSAAGIADDEGLTFISNDLDRRLDWIFASPDVTYLDFKIPQTTASDHLPLVTTVELP